MRDLNTTRHRQRDDYPYDIREGASATVTSLWNGNILTYDVTNKLNTLFYAPDTGTSAPICYSSRVTKDNVTDNWERRQAMGEVIMNDYSSLVRSSRFEPVNLEVTSDPWYGNGTIAYKRYQAQGLLSAIVTPSQFLPYLVEKQTITEDAICDRALTEAYANVSNAEALIAVSIVEAKKTAKLLKQTLGRANNLISKERRLIRRLKKHVGVLPSRKKQFFQAVKKLKGHPLPAVAALANEWLSIRYGWRPLIGEMVSITSAITAIGDRYHRVRVTGHALEGDELPTVVTTPGLRVRGDSETRVICDVSSLDNREATAGLILEARADNISATSLLGGDEILSSAWELVPFSFVVDWFFNTANYVASWQPRFNLALKGSWVTYSERQYRRYEVKGIYSTLDYNLTATATGHESHDYVIRKRWANPTRPILPHVDVRIDWSKCVDLLALIKTNLRGSEWRL